MFFHQVPTAWTQNQGGDAVIQFVLFAFWADKTDGFAIGIAHIELTVDLVFPAWAVGIFKVGHEAFRARVERVNHHFAFNRASDFNAAVEQVGWQRGNFPITRAHVGGFWQKVGQFAGV